MIRSLFLALLLGLSSPAFAFYTVQDTGELLKENELQLGTELQFITSGDDGINVIGRFDKGYDDESNFRFLAGAGTTDFVLGAFYKWVPFPDLEKQPAIGFTFGAQYAHYEGESEIAGRVIPFVSKKFETSLGLLTPYASIPVSLRTYDGDSDTPLQLVIGSRYKHPEFEHCDFTAEIGFKLKDAPAYFSIGAIFPAFEWNKD